MSSTSQIEHHQALAVSVSFSVYTTEEMHVDCSHFWGVEGKQVGSMDEEEPQVRGCYNITFICTPTNQETV